MIICVKVLEPLNRERVCEDPMYSRISEICSWYDLRASVNLRFDREITDCRVKRYSYVDVICFLAAVKLHFYPKQRRSYRVKVGGSKKVFASLSLLSTEL